MARALLLLFLVAPAVRAGAVARVVVRDGDGRPLAGVRVSQYLEIADDGFFAAPLVVRVETDAAGRARIPWRGEPRDSHWVFDKPGYAVQEHYGHVPPEVVTLAPGRTVDARVTGPFGAPRAGVVVEALLGCSHSPAVRRAVTGADGRFVLRDLDPSLARLWFVAPGLAADFHDADDGDIHARPGRVLAGRIVTDEGWPVPRAVVGSQQEMRGPRVRTGPDGRFTLAGWEPGADLVAWAPGDLVAYVGRDEVDPRFEVTIVVRPRHGVRDTDGRPDPDARVVEVPVAVAEAGTGASRPDLDFALVRLADGWVFHGVDGAVEAPPGRYELRVGGPFSSHRAHVRPIVVPQGDARAAVLVEARAQADLVVETAGLPDGAEVSVVTAEGLASLPARLPHDARAVVRVEAPDGRVRCFPVGPAHDGVRTARVVWE